MRGKEETSAVVWAFCSGAPACGILPQLWASLVVESWKGRQAERTPNDGTGWCDNESTTTTGALGPRGRGREEGRWGLAKHKKDLGLSSKPACQPAATRQAKPRHAMPGSH